MSNLFRKESLLVENRFWVATLMVMLVSLGLLYRLWYLQLYKGDYYRGISERNRMRRIEIPVKRGTIFDRHGEVILGNRPFFDLVLIPQFTRDRDATFAALSRLLNMPVKTFETKYKQVQGQPKFLPIYLKRNLTLHEVSIIESNKIFLPGIEVNVAPRRDYKPYAPPHILGYLKEIDKKTLDRKNSASENAKNPYQPGDLIGKHGLESRWESDLRGKRGYRLIQVDAYGRQSNSTDEKLWEYPIVPAIPGSDLELTLDLELQKIAQSAFSGKNGAVVVLDPRTGEVLAAVSAPGYDPEKMQTGLTSEEWRMLTQNPFHPLLDKTTAGQFAPGSIYKPVVALAALEEKIVTPRTTFNCPGFFKLGNQTFACHKRAGHGKVNLRKSLVKSCDVYFYHVGVELGVDTIARYAKDLGLGDKLGLGLNLELPGLVPTSAWKKLTYRYPWTKGDTPNIAIGQGYNLLTPLQMASLYATIANGGKVYKPYIVKGVTNHVGERIKEMQPQLAHESQLISQRSFNIIKGVLQDVVEGEGGTGRRAQVEGHTVAGKTGSIQVVSLKKNRNRTDVSMRWKEHSVFASFSPVKDPEIVVLVFSQNDKVGGGGRSAAPVAQVILEGFYQLKKDRIRQKMIEELQTGVSPSKERPAHARQAAPASPTEG